MFTWGVTDLYCGLPSICYRKISVIYVRRIFPAKSGLYRYLVHCWYFCWLNWSCVYFIFLKTSIFRLRLTAHCSWQQLGLGAAFRQLLLHSSCYSRNYCGCMSSHRIASVFKNSCWARSSCLKQLFPEAAAAAPAVVTWHSNFAAAAVPKATTAAPEAAAPSCHS